MRMAITAACSAKNRLCNHGGVSPLQAITGRNSLIPASLMTQICSGKMKYVLNQDMDREECLRRSERIRQGAIEAFHWLDSHRTLRRALASKLRPPRLELLKEGTTVYIYDPPAKRRGLARRIQDNISWSGPATVVCVERDKRLPGHVWVRLRGRVKAVPLEKVRLATQEELASSHFIVGALEEVQKELTSGRLRAVESDDENAPATPPHFPPELQVDVPVESSSSSSSEMGERDEFGDIETDRMKAEKKLLDDVPMQFRVVPKEQASGARDRDDEEPHAYPFLKKQRLFESLARQYEPPSKLQEAKLRSEMEKAFRQLKNVRKVINTTKQKPKPTSKDVIQKRVVAYVQPEEEDHRPDEGELTSDEPRPTSSSSSETSDSVEVCLPPGACAPERLLGRWFQFESLLGLRSHRGGGDHGAEPDPREHPHGQGQLRQSRFGSLDATCAVGRFSTQ